MYKLKYSKSYRYNELELWLHEMENNYPDKMKLTVLAETPEGRNVYLATLAEFSLGEAAEKRGAYLVKGGIHSQEVFGPTAALAVIERILYETPEVLRDTVFYVIPNINPDGMELAIGSCFGGIRSRNRRISNLPNAIIPSDINGDGMILSMRRKNPLGNMKELEGFPGVMVPRGKGEKKGIFYDVWYEGSVENYDGGEPVLGIEQDDFNRCFPSRWEPNMVKGYPMHATEVRAVAEFEATHLNIFASVDFHNGTAAILGPSAYPDAKSDINDIALVKRIGKLAEKITGLPFMFNCEYKPHDAPQIFSKGTSNVWNYEGLGRSHYVIELGIGLNSIGMKADEIFSKLNIEDAVETMCIKFICGDKEYWEKHKNEIFVQWQRFEHPQLGSVEIGGFKGGNALYLCCEDMDKLIPLTTNFVLRHAAMTPKLEIGNTEVIKLTENIYRIRAEVKNIGELGTRVMQGVGGANAFDKVCTYINKSDDVKILSRPAIFEQLQMRSAERSGMEWFVYAEAGTEIEIISENPRSETAFAKLILPNE